MATRMIGSRYAIELRRALRIVGERLGRRRRLLDDEFFECPSTSSGRAEPGLIRARNSAHGETCMMDVEPGRESSCTMVAMKTFEPRRDSDERQNIQAHGLRGVWRIGRRQAEHLGDLHQSSRIYSFLAYAL